MNDLDLDLSEIAGSRRRFYELEIYCGQCGSIRLKHFPCIGITSEYLLFRDSGLRVNCCTFPSPGYRFIHVRPEDRGFKVCNRCEQIGKAENFPLESEKGTIIATCKACLAMEEHKNELQGEAL